MAPEEEVSNIEEEVQEEDNMEEVQEAVLSGDDALVAAADFLFHRLRDDPQMSKFEEDDLPKVAEALHRLMGGTFNGEDWPEVDVTASLIDEGYEDFSSVLLDASHKWEDNLLAGLEAMIDEMMEDERLQRFFENIRCAAITGEDALEEGQGENEGGEDAEIGQDDGNDIRVNSFTELRLEENVVKETNDCWNMFIATAASRDAAGEAIYAALFESAPSLQSLFVTPRAVQALRFMNGIESFVEALTDPPKLKILVETLGFGHMHLDVTVPRVVIFRDAIVDLFIVELAERFSSRAREGFRKLLNYVGGAIIYVKAHYAERVTCLLKSWKQANHGDDSDQKGEGASSDSADIGKAKTEQQKKAGWGALNSASKNATEGTKEGGVGHIAGAATGAEAGNIGTQSIPTTYPEMFMFNAAVMGFGQSAWMTEVLLCFDNIVTNVANSSRLQEEADVLCLRIATVVKGNINLAEYKSCMLASLRSLLPKDWDSAHEVAWTWLWDNVERLILRIQGKPPLWERALNKCLSGFDEDQKFQIRKDIYSTFFTAAPAGQDFFKQSNTYLHFIADKIMNMTLELYQNPVKMVDDVSALGLRHVGYAIPPVFFGPFVSACVEVLGTRTSDETTLESFRWSLALIAKMLTRTITEGSTIVMKAINENSQKLLRKAIGCAPRGERAPWLLIVQVGTQSISPLAWSVEAGNLEAAYAIVQDLLTFRADRERYYFGVDELFKRHPDIIKILCDQAPDIVPFLLNCLIWRSRLTDNGTRRVNYYVKHLLVDADANFSKTLHWVSALKDPKLMCHPVVVFVADTVWSKVAYRSFLFGKSWAIFTLLIFLLSQSILEHAMDHDANGNGKDAERWAVFFCRVFIYVLCMPQFLFRHIRDTIKAYKKKDTITLGCLSIPRYLRQWQDAANFTLTVCLIIMLCAEPILWCMEYAHDMLFMEKCEERKGWRLFYTIFSMLAMFLYYVLLIDLSVVSTRISAFSLVCVRMLSEVALFLGALATAVLTFASAGSVLKQSNPDFQGIHKGAFAILRMALGAYDARRYEVLENDPALLVMVFVFLICVVIFFLSMLVAQLSCAYGSVYEDMVGYARLERAETIVELMPSVPKKRWETFVASLRLNKRVEFNAGDIGIAGGIQMREPANLNPTTVDMIKRFGGSTSQDIQWPEDEADGDGDDRFERMEKLIQKALQRVTKNGRQKGHGSTGGGGTGTGTGTGSASKSSSGGGDAED